MSPPKGRKRSREGGSPGKPSKRARETSSEVYRPFTREGSPSKNVHFPRQLVIGPSESDPNRRSQSPVRSALHTREDAVDSPGAQLQVEQDAAHPDAARNKKRKTRAGTKAQKGSQNTILSPTALLDGALNVRTGSGRWIEIAGSHDYVCDQMNALRSKVQDFADSFPPNRKPDALFSLLKPENNQLVRYIGCLAMGGKSGAKGWQALLSDATCRRALVFGVVGRALKEKVFDELCFGADAQLNEILSKKERNHVQQDGKSEYQLSTELHSHIRQVSSVQDREQIRF